jgi:hypothetical protein
MEKGFQIFIIPFSPTSLPFPFAIYLTPAPTLSLIGRFRKCREDPIKWSDRPGSPTCEWFIRIRKVRQNLEEEKIFRRKSSNHEAENAEG